MDIYVLEKLFDSPIAFQRIFVDLTGNVQSALMLSQGFYWSKRTTLKDRWFYKSADEWEAETGLTRHEQVTARKHLKKTTFWEEKLSGVPATVHFRIDILALFASLTGHSKLDGKVAGSQQTSFTGHGKHSITETTTETTTAESKDSSYQKPLFEDKEVAEYRNTKKTKKEKGPQDEIYEAFKKIWIDEFPELGFNGMAGLKIKSLMTHTTDIIKLNNGERTKEKMVGIFEYIIAYTKRANHFAYGKSINVFDAKYREIYREIKEGKPVAQKKPTSAMFGKYKDLNI